MTNTETSTVEDQQPKPIERKTESDIQEIANGVKSGSIFCSLQIQDPQLMGSVFMPIGLGAFSSVPSDYLRTIGMIYAYMSDAGPRAINDYPMFFSMKLLHVEDMPIFMNRIREIEKAMGQIPADPSPVPEQETSRPDLSAISSDELEAELARRNSG